MNIDKVIAQIVSNPRWMENVISRYGDRGSVSTDALANAIIDLRDSLEERMSRARHDDNFPNREYIY